MENEALHIRYLIGVAAILCAVIIGYNLFFVPDAAMTAVVYADSSSVRSGMENTGSGTVNSEGYTPSQSKIASKAVTGKVNINTATAQQLDSGLPEIGSVIAKRIVEYREKNGKFKTIEAIKNVSGIGDKTFEKLRNFITVD